MIPKFLKATRTRRLIVVGWLMVIGILSIHIIVPYNPDNQLGFTLFSWFVAFWFGLLVVLVVGNFIYYVIRWILTGKGLD